MTQTLAVAALTAALPLLIGSAHAQVGEIKAQAPPLSLEQLVGYSEKIVLGKVTEQSITTKVLSDGKNEVSTPVYQIQLYLEEVLKGSAKPGETLTVLQWANIAQPVKEGDELLLYLPPASRLGLSSPVGIYSGQFKITRTKDGKEEKQATNLNNNMGLWSDRKSLYASTPKVSFDILGTRLSEKGSEVRAQAIDEASKPNKPGPLSVDLITSATKVLTGM
jgi:hypothetical protein